MPEFVYLGCLIVQGLDWIGLGRSSHMFPSPWDLLVHARMAQPHRNEIKTSDLPNLTSFTQHVIFFH